MMRHSRTLQSIALAVLTLALPGCRKVAPEPSKPPDPGKSLEETLQIVILNADEYRQEITDIDRLVFDEKRFDVDRRALLATKLGELAERVKTAGESHFLEIESYEIKKLAEITSKISEEGFRSQIPNQWMRIRNNLFDDRSWFARSAADLDPAPSAPR